MLLGDYDTNQNPDCNVEDISECVPKVQNYDVEYVVLHQYYNFDIRNTTYDIALLRTTQVVLYDGMYKKGI